MRVLVTGATGFIGHAAVHSLRSLGWEVHAVGRTPAEAPNDVAWHALDVLEPGVRLPDVGATHLLHLAWTTAHGAFWDDAANLSWAAATANLVEQFGRQGGERLVFAGSCAQYAWDRHEPAHEQATPRTPASLYGRAKQATSDLLDAWAAETGCSCATGLLFFPYGPGDKPDRLVPSVARRLLAGEEAPVGPGTQVRDFVYVTDAGAGLAALLASEVSGSVNIGTGQAVSIAEVARTVARVVGREDLLRIGALPSADTDSSIVADISRLRDEVGFTPAVDLEAGLRLTVERLSADAAEVAAR